MRKGSKKIKNRNDRKWSGGRDVEEYRVIWGAKASIFVKGVGAGGRLNW